ncbi:MAG: hypothetical protein E7487_10730, partial [Ruminococcaceae bacterium]|nr:hypothetical protein [Oscillospiraceae bacterium]
MSKKIAVVFAEEISEVSFSCTYGKTKVIEKKHGQRWEIEITEEKSEAGAFSTRATVRTEKCGFTFFLRDICAKAPVYIPQYGVAVTEADDERDYETISSAIKAQGNLSAVEKMEAAPETSFESCIAGNRELKSPTWLGISRDMRIFEIAIRDYCAERWDCVIPRNFGEYVKNDEIETQHVRYEFMTGRGIGCESNIKRR